MRGGASDGIHIPFARVARSQVGIVVVLYIEIVAKVAAFLLVEVYDSYGLWYLSSEMIRIIRFIALVQVLGSRANAEELERLLCVS